MPELQTRGGIQVGKVLEQGIMKNALADRTKRGDELFLHAFLDSREAVHAAAYDGAVLNDKFRHELQLAIA